MEKILPNDDALFELVRKMVAYLVKEKRKWKMIESTDKEETFERDNK